MKISAIKLAAAAMSCIVATSCSQGGGEASASDAASQDTLLMVVGSYSSADEEGVSLYEFNQADGSSRRLAGLKGISNPSFVAIGADGNRIYSVGEDNGNTSTINTIYFDRDSLTMTLAATDTTGGGAPCHVNIANDGTRDTHVITANYLGGSVTIYALDAVGKPQGEPQVIRFSGHGPDLDRQGQPHAHFTAFTPDSTRLLVTDLGTDKVHIFPVTGGEALIDSSAMTDLDLAPGAGPRHIDFLPSKGKAYLIDEIDGNVNVIDVATMKVDQIIRADSVGAQGSGDIHVSPDGRFLYASNRLQADGIAVFSIDPATGLLTYAGYQLTGAHPRNFAITPNGRYMLVACRDTNAIEIYSIDPSTGLLTKTGQEIRTQRPVCIKFI